MTAPRVLAESVRLEVALPGTDGVAVDAVRLDLDPALSGRRDFALVAAPAADGRTRWRLDLPRPSVQRFEYRLAVSVGGAERTVLDPGNPVTVDTPSGQRSVVLMPSYAVPGWLTAPSSEGVRTRTRLHGATIRPVPLTVWSPAGLPDTEPLPMLFVHDGPEYDALAGLTRYSGAMIAAGRLPPHRVVLATPVRRNAWYSGSRAYLRSVAGAGLSRLTRRFATRGPVVIMGGSLGGLAALLVGLHPAGGNGTVGGVFAQSGSFFSVRHDGQEAGFAHFGRVTRAVQQVLDAPRAGRPLRIAMTCGASEENAANNRQMSAALSRAGHTVTYREVPDLHGYTAWRDALDPALTALLASCW